MVASTTSNTALSVAQEAYQAGFRGQALQTATAIALAESSGNPQAVNASDPNGGSYGLWQINGVHAPGGTATPAWERQMFNPANNAAEAFAVSSQGTNFQPWSTYTSGAYRQYLPVASDAANQVTTSGGVLTNFTPFWGLFGGGQMPKSPIHGMPGESSTPSNAPSSAAAATSGSTYHTWASEPVMKVGFLGTILDKGQAKAIVSGGIIIVGGLTAVVGLIVMLVSGAAGSPQARAGAALAATPVAGGVAKKIAGKR